MSRTATPALSTDFKSIAPAARPLRITFVVTGLAVGGAEMMLWKLLSRLDRARFEPIVISLSEQATAMLPRFRQLGVPCELLGWRLGVHALTGMRRLARILQALEPDIVQGWMYHGNIAATLASRLAGLKAPVLWNVRAMLMEHQKEKPGTALMIRLGGMLSFSPAKIINNSAASADEHEVRMGYRSSKRVILPNGFDTDTFRPSPEARSALRKFLGLAEDALLIGLVARYHPIKDHRTFLHAAALVKAICPAARFVLAGEHVDASNPDLAALLVQYGVTHEVHLIGPRDDVHAVSAALDIQVCSSSSEGFPNVIGEAMSCGVPCVVTDVGDCAYVVADTGVTVPPRNPQALAAGITRLIEIGPDKRAELGARARERAIDKFSLEAVVRGYEELYLQMHEIARSG
jgi:glycosyltransferase involved in cell wall biosynthesis